MRNKKGRLAGAAAACLALVLMQTQTEAMGAIPAGPGFEGVTIEIYGGPAVNNPAYNTGWDMSAGPGSAGSNPMGSDSSDRDSVLAKGPGSEAVQQLLEEQENTFYVFSTYRGGVWEQQADGRWKLLKPDGQPVSSQWAYVDGKTYLLDMYGIMQTGWQRVNDSWYYFNSVGAMQTGWLLKEGKYYFLNADGDMATGWVNSLGDWYYFDSRTGVMQTNTYTPDGRYVNAEGVLIP